MKFKENSGLETISTEYKEFTFYSCGLNIDNNDAIELIQNNKWIFNKNVIYSLENMITTYLPKYTCAYLSSNIDINCDLYFGVNDIGDLIGIPFQGYLDIHHIENYVKMVYKNNIQFDGNIMDYVTIDIIKLENDSFIVKNINPKFIQYTKYLKIYNEKKKKYLSNKLTWVKLTNRYNAKLCDLANTLDTRIELLQYIQFYDPKNNVIKLLKNGLQLEHKNMDYVNKYKNNKNSVYYWLTEWKDKMLQFVKVIKPKLLYKIPNEYFPLHILLTVNNMIPYWTKFNDNINLFIIKFTFTKQQNLLIKYKTIYDEWSQCKRIIQNDHPCCIHY